MASFPSDSALERQPSEMVWLEFDLQGWTHHTYRRASGSHSTCIQSKCSKKCESQSKPGTKIVNPEVERRLQLFPAGTAPYEPSSTRVLIVAHVFLARTCYSICCSVMEPPIEPRTARAETKKHIDKLRSGWQDATCKGRDLCHPVGCNHITRDTG